MSSSAHGDTAAVTDFLQRVVPWPQNGAPGVINMHWTFPNRAGVGGKPFDQLHEFCQFIAWANNQPDKIKDIYFCLSQQAKTGPVHNGRAKVLRNTKNATFLKAIWLDLDGSKTDPEKGYPSQKTALLALNKFIKDSGYPFPTAIINSGNGFHVYWISNKPMTADDWRPCAEALWQATQQHRLACDPVTTDVVRILRVPGTVNHKTVPPKKVEIAYLDPTDYDFTTLPKVASPAGKPAATFAGLTPEPFTGVHDNTPLDYAGVFAGCPHFRETFKAHGRDSSQGLWMLDVLASTFFEDGKRVAHTLSEGYPRYTKEETDAMWDRKMRDRKERGLGWPGCQAFKSAGCELCATCKHFGKIKSPLNLARPLASFVDPYAEFAGPWFPLDVLPPTLANFVDAEHRAMGADPSAIAMAALTAVAGAIHAQTLMCAGEGWWERPILWTALVGQPSTMKSPIVEKAKKPLNHIDQERHKRWQQEFAIWQQQNKK